MQNKIVSKIKFKREIFLARFFSVFTGMLLFPGFVFAQQINTLGDFAGLFLRIFDVLVGLVITVCLIVFLWGVSKFIRSSDNEQERTSAKEYMIWGIVTLFVMVSVWGLVQVLVDTFGFSDKRVDLFPPL